LQARYGASERQVCIALRVSRSSFRYRSVADDDSALRLRIREITETRVHYGYRRVHVMLRREGWRDNHKRIYRLYCEQGLSLRLKRPRRNKSARRRQPQPQGLYPNHVWGMDFVSDALFNGRRLRLLTVLDLYTRECLGICVGQNLRSIEVAEMLNSIALRRPLPQLLKTDNGSEFAGKMLDRWVYERGIRIDFSRPGTPMDNATVESLNGRLRQECLNENWFMSLEDARCKIEAWRIHYNQSRHHSALGWMTPSEFAEKSAGCQNTQLQKPVIADYEWITYGERVRQTRIKLTYGCGIRVLNEVELRKFLKWLPSSAYIPKIKNVLRLTLWTGCRTGEVCDMAWEDVDLDKGTIHLRETKTGVERYVQLSTQAIDFLKVLRLNSDKYLFPSQATKKPIQQKYLTENSWRLRESGQMLDIPHWTPHDLRRTVRTGLSRLQSK